MKIFKELIEQAEELRDLGNVNEKCYGNGIVYAVNSIKQSINNDIIDRLKEEQKETKEYIIERAMIGRRRKYYSEEQIEELFDINMTSDLFKNYEESDWEYHNYDLGKYHTLKDVIKLLEYE